MHKVCRLAVPSARLASSRGSSRLAGALFTGPLPHVRALRNRSRPDYEDGDGGHDIDAGSGQPAAADDEEATPSAEEARVIELTRRWADQVVVGLRLCPFARLDETRIVCAPAGEADDLSSFLAFLRKEVQVLHDQPHVASTLVALPHVEDFAQFEAFNAAVNIATEDLSTDDDGEEVETVHQIAQFHPRFRYEGEEEDSVENYTSRSPYPTVHLIRASIITAAREVRKRGPSAMSSADQDSTLASNKKEAQHKKTKKTTPRA
ncbi:protein of function, putative [Acanthamoeba castellanii str. Neff]|uniref:Protein of function, putative n=1 Tax=Acanthamoeba castellanii (strain ATCC 30010 / Neff) TaxID=1257118 RepID=L8HKI8_ACACF|nr:protein of function, putative [Acanthamoeba castellanii str. Neff]ELR25178.1 protein of function, putative [Acanthamoeba castellanii str. Neff]